MRNPYIGHESQLYGVEETRLVGGKGDGMRLLQVRNAAGLAFTVAADRCADIYRLSFRGVNMGFFAPNGYVAPRFYQEPGKGFLKSFTAGFFTTCGLNNVGAPCEVDGVAYPLHGTVGNTPAERVRCSETEDTIEIHAVINDSCIFSRKLVLHRTLTCWKFENRLTITDTVENCGDQPEPIFLMYHMNMGYPLLTEQAQLENNSDYVMQGETRVGDIWRKTEPPQPGKPEICYRHYYGEGKTAAATIRNPEIRKGVTISFDPEAFPCMVQWNKFSYRDYALGLEPRSTCYGGRAGTKAHGEDTSLEPGARRTYRVTVDFFEF